MARHRHVRSLDVDEEYEHSIEYENEYLCDSPDDNNASSSAMKRMILSDFIVPTTHIESKKKKKADIGENQDKTATYVNVSPNISEFEDYSADSNCLKINEFTQVKKKLDFPDSPTATLKKISFDDSGFKKASKVYEARNSVELSVINLAVIGHVDAGKSTVMGNIMVKLGYVSNDVIFKYRKQSEQFSKSSSVYAWIFDETNEERKRGITIDVAQRQFNTSSHSFIILDTPGHNDFISKMISGTSEADAAILIIDASFGNFESGFQDNGQTKEHVILAKALGLSQLVIAVNKMDSVYWKQERYLEIVSIMSAFLKKVGFENFQFIPCSGLLGINLVELSHVPNFNSWYKGISLLDAINKFQAPKRILQNSFRLSVSDIFKVTDKKVSISGRIQSGYIKVHDQVIIMPEKYICTVSNVLKDEVPTKYGFVGDRIELQLSGPDNIQLHTGSVICNLKNPINVSSKFRARLNIFNIQIPVTSGFPVDFQNHSFCEQAVIHKLISVLSKSNGEPIRKKPRFLLKNSWADVEISIIRPVCIELYKDVKELGRFLLRYKNISIAAGIVTEILF